MGIIIGKGAVTRKRIEQTASCRLVTGPRGSDDVTVYVRKPENIDRARTQIELLLDGKRFDRPATHFLSFSLAVQP